MKKCWNKKPAQRGAKSQEHIQDFGNVMMGLHTKA